ncbi:MAG: hypothetical protein H0V05_05800, partial [Euzebyaceae bacterium]|nr:hypothetical protein [Euzebyaceae bacterium]
MLKRAEIDQLARLLDGDSLLDEGVLPGARELVALAGVLQTATLPVPRPEFRLDLRTRLVTAAREQASGPAFLDRIREAVGGAGTRWWYPARLAALAVTAVMALSGGGVAVAAERALPGDVLYTVKLQLEGVRLALTWDDVARGRRMLSYAEDRLAEARTAAEAGDLEGAAVALRAADGT